MVNVATLRLISSAVGLTWNEAWEEFHDAKLLEGRAVGSVQQYRFALDPLRRWMLNTFGHERLADLSEANAKAYLAHFKAHGARGRRPVGQKRLFEVREHLNRFFGWLTEKGYILQNPFAHIKIEKPRWDERLLPELPPELIERLLQHVDTTSFAGKRDRMFLLLITDTGLRLNEALSVRANEELLAGNVTLTGKGNRERAVGLSTKCRLQLVPYNRDRKKHLESTGRTDSKWLFPNPEGERLATRTMQERIRELASRAGIEGVRVSAHTFRHTYGLNWLRQGGGELKLMHTLGHATLAMTHRYCVQAAREVKDEMRKFSPLASMDIPPVSGQRRPHRVTEGEGAAPGRG